MKHPVHGLLKTFSVHAEKLKQIYDEQINQQVFSIFVVPYKFF